MMDPTPGSLLSRAADSALAAIMAALISAALVVLLRPLLQRYALARPNARSSHVIPTPQGAGIAVIVATIAACMSLTVGFGGPTLLLLFAATLFIATVGLVDDIRTLGVVPRLFLQVAAVALVVYAAPAELRLFPQLPLVAERSVLVFAGLWFVNLVNFMDGLDLITVAEVVPITATLAIVGTLGMLPAGPALVAAALCGAMLGFAPFNRPVARVFLGDVGSLPIGLLLGWCLLQLAWNGHLTAALLLPLYYLADATLTLLRRMMRRERFWAAHRSHFYQRATTNGFAVLDVIGHVAALNVMLATLAIATILTESRVVHAGFLAAGGVLVGLVLRRFSTGTGPKPAG